MLDFLLFPSVKSITISIKQRLETLNSKDWGQKRSQSNKNDLKVFCENLPSDSLFSSKF